MIIEINIPLELEEKTRRAFARFGYSETISNPEPRPEPVYKITHKKDKEGNEIEDTKLVNQKELDSYQSQIPNPVSIDDYIKLALIDFVKTRIAKHEAELARQNLSQIS